MNVAPMQKAYVKCKQRHRCQLVDHLPTNSHAFSVPLAHGVVEVERLGQQTGWHAREEAEDHECDKVSERHRAAGDCESLMVGGSPIPPRKEARQSAWTACS